MIDFDKIEKKLNEVLENETQEGWENFLEKERAELIKQQIKAETKITYGIGITLKGFRVFWGNDDGMLTRWGTDIINEDIVKKHINSIVEFADAVVEYLKKKFPNEKKAEFQGSNPNELNNTITLPLTTENVRRHTTVYDKYRFDKRTIFERKPGGVFMNRDERTVYLGATEFYGEFIDIVYQHLKLYDFYKEDKWITRYIKVDTCYECPLQGENCPVWRLMTNDERMQLAKPGMTGRMFVEKCPLPILNKEEK